MTTRRLLLLVLFLVLIGPLATGRGVAQSKKERKQAQKLLDKIKLVDGSGSGLDADTVQGRTVDQLLPAVPGPLSATEVLERLKQVDGTGSGLDADRVRGLTPAQLAGPQRIDLTFHDFAGFAPGTNRLVALSRIPDGATITRIVIRARDRTPGSIDNIEVQRLPYTVGGDFGQAEAVSTGGYGREITERVLTPADLQSGPFPLKTLTVDHDSALWFILATNPTVAPIDVISVVVEYTLPAGG